MHEGIIQYELDEQHKPFGFIWRDREKEGDPENAYFAIFKRENSGLALHFYNKLVGLRHPSLMGPIAMEWDVPSQIVVFLDGPKYKYSDLLKENQGALLFLSNGGLTNLGKSLLLSFVDLICHLQTKEVAFNDVGYSDVFFEDTNMQKPRFLIFPHQTGTTSNAGVQSHLKMFLKSLVEYHNIPQSIQRKKFLDSLTKITPQTRKETNRMCCALMDHPFLADIKRQKLFFDDLYTHWYKEKCIETWGWRQKRKNVLNGWELGLQGHYKYLYDWKVVDYCNKRIGNHEGGTSPYDSDIYEMVKFIQDMYEHFNDAAIKDAQENGLCDTVELATEEQILKAIFAQIPDLAIEAYDFVHFRYFGSHRYCCTNYYYCYFAADNFIGGLLLDAVLDVLVFVLLLFFVVFADVLFFSSCLELIQS